MKKDNLKETVPNDGSNEMSKKNYTTPTVKEYGSINDLVKIIPRVKPVPESDIVYDFSSCSGNANREIGVNRHKVVLPLPESS